LAEGTSLLLLLVAIADGSWATAKKEDLLGVFFLPTKEKYEAYENYCELGDLCFRMNSVVILLRVIKDAMNWMDTWLQWNLGPALFGNNEKYFQACCEVIFGELPPSPT
jgi:hypothetical protein